MFTGKCNVDSFSTALSFAYINAECLLPVPETCRAYGCK